MLITSSEFDPLETWFAIPVRNRESNRIVPPITAALLVAHG